MGSFSADAANVKRESGPWWKERIGDSSAVCDVKRASVRASASHKEEHF